MCLDTDLYAGTYPGGFCWLYRLCRKAGNIPYVLQYTPDEARASIH